MSLKVSFSVSGVDTPVPPTTEFPAPPRVGDIIEYINKDRNTVSKVTAVRYVIGKGELQVVVTLDEVSTQ